ncbi:Ig-like domain-containing protein [Paenibacillus harenae]|uniref:Parallel beta-helix repeat protein n=1 Tax=Paenibacillus harenae TaxID=306543 RepID=A0ABT9U9I3_PAEHA|nr:Ig-like domain-containing protein [Paenibacillus harenae]MDQ0114849.1 parallel beta-helix repeat protein [Paenibacillus harenae]
MNNELSLEGWVVSNKTQRGIYNNQTIYYKGDIVQDNESHFRSLTDANSGNPTSDASSWEAYVPDIETSIINDEDENSFVTTLSANKIKALITQMISNIPAMSLDGLSDADTSSYDPVEGDVITFHEGRWIPASFINKINLPDNITNLQVVEVTETSAAIQWTLNGKGDSFDIYINNEFSKNIPNSPFVIDQLQAETNYDFTVKTKNAYGTSEGVSISVTTLPSSNQQDDSLVFHLDFSKYAGSTANTVNDSVKNTPCTLHNVQHDGVNDGWLDHRGLTLGVNGYVSIPPSADIFNNAVDLNENGVTFEFVAYETLGVLFRSEAMNLLAYLAANPNTRIGYMNTAGSEQIGTGGYSWFVHLNGNRTATDTLHGSHELNVVSVRIYPDGQFDMAINGKMSLNKNKLSNFSEHLPFLKMSPLHIRRNSLGLNKSATTIRSFSIYNKALSDEVLLNQYNSIKTGEPLSTVTVYPSEVTLGSGENQVLAVVASPSRYTALVNNQFESGNEGYAAVDNDGLLTGLHEGETLISVTSTYQDKTFVNYVPVKVGTSIVKPPTSIRQVTGISINRKPETLEIGQSFAAMATTLPFDVYDDNIVIWTSSNPEVCSVNFGVLKGISAGEVTITASDGSETYSRSFTVTVVQPEVRVISDEEIYNVPLAVYAINPDNADALNTTNGIRKALDYASSTGYKKIVFPLGTYLITPEAGTIFVPTEMVIDFSDSVIHIEPSSLTAAGYTMFRFERVSYTKIINAKFYGEADSAAVSGSSEKCITFIISDAYRSGLENCTISKSPGFNIATHVERGTDEQRRHPSVSNFEAGNIDEETGLNDNSSTKNCFRNITYLHVSELGGHFMLGYTQGYFNYPYLRSRLYSIFFYDRNYRFIQSQMYNLQYYNYEKPTNAYYAKIVIYQESAPTNEDNDFKAVAMLRTMIMPTDCFIRNCVIEDNYSCGIALTGGQGWVIENNRFNRNGKRMPSCDIDWEDGWEASVGDICRNNTFNSPSGVIISGGSSIALYSNTFNESNLHIWARSANFRVYNNIFNGKGANRNLSLSCQAESYFSKNVLSGVAYTTAINHPEGNYRVRDTGNTLI